MYTFAVITASDKGFAGEREDTSGKLIIKMMTEKGYKLVKYVILPDDKQTIYEELCKMSDILEANLILTTGGTGFSKRDVTPEATMKAIDRHAPGIAEAIRYNSLQITPKGMLSRGVSGMRGETLIVNMPGSRKAVEESLSYIIEPLHHGLEILNGDTANCGRK